MMPGQRDPSRPNSRYNGRRGRGTTGATNPVVRLPSEGCRLPVPSLPKGRAWSKEERARWRELWRSPQAAQWDESATGTVAALVVYEAAVLDGSASAWQAQEARYAAESLGLTPKAMVTLGWVITDE